MLWLIESKYTQSPDIVEKYTQEHRNWLDQHYKSGVFITSGRKNDNSGGVIFAQAESLEELQKIFSSDPFVVNNCSEYRYIAFNPVKRNKILDLQNIPLVE